jgi:hypothetical protein
MADYRPPTNMFLAGIPVPDRLVLELARRLRDAELLETTTAPPRNRRSRGRVIDDDARTRQPEGSPSLGYCRSRRRTRRRSQQTTQSTGPRYRRRIPTTCAPPDP